MRKSQKNVEWERMKQPNGVRTEVQTAQQTNSPHSAVVGKYPFSMSSWLYTHTEYCHNACISSEWWTTVHFLFPSPSSMCFHALCLIRHLWGFYHFAADNNVVVATQNAARSLTSGPCWRCDHHFNYVNLLHEVAFATGRWTVKKQKIRPSRKVAATIINFRKKETK